MPANHLYQIRDDKDVILVTFLEENLSARADIDQMFIALSHLTESRPHPKVVFNFRNVSNLSSVFIGKLLALAKRVDKAKGSIELNEVNEQVLEVLTLTRMTERFAVRETSDPPIPPQIPRSLQPSLFWLWILLAITGGAMLAGIVMFIADWIRNAN